MPAPSASTPLLPNLNQHVALEPLEGPIPEAILSHPTFFLAPRNWEAKFEEGSGEGKALDLEEIMGWWVMHGIEAIAGVVLQENLRWWYFVPLPVTSSIIHPHVRKIETGNDKVLSIHFMSLWKNILGRSYMILGRLYCGWLYYNICFYRMFGLLYETQNYGLEKVARYKLLLKIWSTLDFPKIKSN